MKLSGRQHLNSILHGCIFILKAKRRTGWGRDELHRLKPWIDAKAKVKGVLHDAVVHCKKKQLVKGKAKWAAPQYVRVVSQKLPGGKVLKVKAGTQHIDRAWRFLKDRLRLNQHVKAGTKAIRNRIRSAQYEYWHRGSDLWLHTGILVKEAMSHYVHKI